MLSESEPQIIASTISVLDLVLAKLADLGLAVPSAKFEGRMPPAARLRRAGHELAVGMAALMAGEPCIITAVLDRTCIVEGPGGRMDRRVALVKDVLVDPDAVSWRAVAAYPGYAARVAAHAGVRLTPWRGRPRKTEA